MKKISFLLLIIAQGFVYGQTELVFVFFKDKPSKSVFYNNPSIELSTKSLERRSKLNIALNDSDAPIEVSYIQNIKNLGFTVNDQSKWLNGVAVNANSTEIENLKNQPYVSKVESFVKNKNNNTGKIIQQNSKYETLQNANASDFVYGNAAAQIEQINLRQLHALGYTGKGISIAVLDTEFPEVNTASSFSRLRDNNQIKGTYNFTNKTENVYNTYNSYHGSNCLSIIGGYINGSFVGSAPDAEFYLYTTEYQPQELPEEELYWIQAAEQADRVGVDIISSSLGYAYDFTEPRYDYAFSDMTGNRTFIARGAQLASDKGIIVVVAAGNEGNDQWRRIVSPGDNTSVFTIGSNTANNTASPFSSYGPNALGQQKPDASARGTSTYYTSGNNTTSGNGTSYATPLAAGGIACLLQALDTNTNRESIKDRLRETASLYPSYNTQLGNGILNFYNAYQEITLKSKDYKMITDFKVYPNPTLNSFKIRTDQKIENIEVFDTLGRKITAFKQQEEYDIKDIKSGTYFIKITTPSQSTVEKLLKK